MVFFFKTCSQNLSPSKTLVAMATKWNFLSNFFENLLWNRWYEFEIISQDCSLCDPFQKLFAKFWSVKNHNRRGGGGGGGKDFFALYGHEEILKKKTSPKPLVRIWNNFTRLFLEKFCIILLLWNCLSDFEIINRIVLWVTLFKIYSRNFDPWKNMAAMWGKRETFCTIWTWRNS